MDQEKTFRSSVDLYTGLASGFDIASNEDDRLDFFAVNNAFDNIISIVRSRATIEETGLRLMCWSIYNQDSLAAILTPEHAKRLTELVPSDVLANMKGKSLERIFFDLSIIKADDPSSFINKILNSNSEIYSISTIAGSLQVKRKLASDLLDLTISAHHPRLAQKSLEILIDVFSRKYRSLKSSEIHSVVDYFEEQKTLAYDRLKEAEERFKDYSTENKVINYNEQTKFIAESKQEVERDKQLELVKLAGAERSLNQLSQKIEVKKGIFDINEKISQKKEELSEVNHLIAQSEILNEEVGRLEKLKEEARKLKKEIRAVVDSSFDYNNTTEGIHRNQILKEWLNNYLIVDETKGRLEVINTRLKDFDRIYYEYAPLGSNLKRLERETDVYEAEYLEALHSLNLAKLRERNVEFANRLSVIAAPNFPINAEPSKRKMLVILAALVGGVFALGFFVLKAILDTNIRTPEKAEAVTGLKVQSGFPHLDKLPKNVFREVLIERNLNQLIGSTKIRFAQAGIVRKPKVIGLYSLRPAEGKTTFVANLAKTLAKFGSKVEVIFPQNHEEQVKGYFKDVDKYVKTFFMSDNWFYGNRDFTILNTGFDGDTPDYVIIEMPDFSQIQIPASLCKNIDVLYQVLDMDRSWMQIDDHILEKFKGVLGDAQPELLLNRLFAWHLENLSGEIPKERSGIRQAIKRLMVR